MFKGGHTDEEALIEVLCTRTPRQLKMLAYAYSECKYKAFTRVNE